MNEINNINGHKKHQSCFDGETKSKKVRFPTVSQTICTQENVNLNKNDNMTNQLKPLIKTKDSFLRNKLSSSRSRIFNSFNYCKNIKYSSQFDQSTKNSFKINRQTSLCSLWLKSSYKSKIKLNQMTKTFNQNLGKSLKENKDLMNRTIHNNRAKMDTSYINFYNNQTKYQEMIEQTKKRQKSKKKTDVFALVNQLTLKKIDAPLQQINQYRFHTNYMRNECFDSPFSSIRYGSTLISSEQNLYLFGGYSQKGIDQPLNFHKYNFIKKQWKKINTCELKSKRNIMYGIDPPNLSYCYHTAQSYRNHLIFIGGMSMDVNNQKRYFNHDINFFHTQRGQWGRIKWNYSIRSHASTLYGNTLVVYGGINEKEEYTNEIRLVTLNNGNLSHSYHYQLGIKNYTKNTDEITVIKNHHYSIAHHQMINTYDVDPLFLKDMANGIFVFGGRTSNGVLDNNLRYMDYNKLTQLGQNTTSKAKISQLWEIANISGKKPEGRYQHSLTMIKKKGIALLIGGRDSLGHVLCDSWILDLIRLTWINVSYVQKNNIINSKQGIYGHTTTCINNHFFVFGGYFGNGQFSTSFWNMNYQFKKIQRVQRKSNKLMRKSSRPDIKICSIKNLLSFYNQNKDKIKE